ncbi:MAG: hypothetical protein K2X86_13430 [Cytophagaceae bacterium]|nr:hypothetical protein [Cytophagaceae bacterium]
MKTKFGKSLSSLETLAKEHALYPQESLLEVKNKEQRLFIGIPKEKEDLESRVCLTPESVALLVNNGHEIVVETGAGNNSKFTDQEYSEAGAKIAYSTEEVFGSDIVLKVEPPTLQEISYMKQGKTLISALQMASMKSDLINAIVKNKTTIVLTSQYFETFYHAYLT